MRLQLKTQLSRCRDIYCSCKFNSMICQDLMGNINIVLVYISSRLEQVTERRGGSLSVEEVQEVVRQGATQFPRDRLTKLPDLKFKYVEEDKPEDFFIPYVWSLAQTKMYWNPQHIKLFSS